MPPELQRKQQHAGTAIMRFGDYIRELRRKHQWTQPEAAKEVGIEQSYLSKLESGKSYPSEDVFSSLMTAYKIELRDLNARLFPAELDRLREINQVRALILNSERDTRIRVQQWLIFGICALMVGGACLGTAWLAEETEITKFLYKAEAETVEAEGHDKLKDNGDGPVADELSAQIIRDRQQETTRRIDELYKSIEDYRGVVFFEDVSGGKRIWRFYGSNNETIQSPLRLFMVPAVMLIMGALGCFFASYRSR